MITAPTRILTASVLRNMKFVWESKHRRLSSLPTSIEIGAGT